MVLGQNIDEHKINNLVSKADLIIAHNANFDRKFVEQLFPIFKNKIWGCTGLQIPWREESITSAKLEHLANYFGVFYDAHRAEIDCLIGIHVLSQKLPFTGTQALKYVLDDLEKQYYRLWAEKSPFHLKDILKARRYKWNDGNNLKPKAWYKEVSIDLKNEEIEFLHCEIYGYEADFKIEQICSTDRFSER